MINLIGRRSLEADALRLWTCQMRTIHFLPTIHQQFGHFKSMSCGCFKIDSNSIGNCAIRPFRPPIGVLNKLSLLNCIVNRID